ncbi:MAG: hypothetical protein U0939_18940 [Pirellulales bacterium]
MLETMELLTDDCRFLVDQKLDSVDRVLLLAGVPRPTRRLILEELETTTLALIAEQAGERAPQPEQVLAVLAQLDAPEFYAPEAYRAKARSAAQGKTPRPKIRRPQVAVSAIVSMGLAFFNIPLLFAGGYLGFMALSEGETEVLLYAAFVLVPCFLMTLASGGLGIWSILKIRKSDGWLYGIGCAIPGVAVIPLLFLQVIFAGVLYIGTMGVGLALLPCLYVGATTAFMCHGLWHWLADDYEIREPEVIEASV